MDTPIGATGGEQHQQKDTKPNTAAQRHAKAPYSVQPEKTEQNLTQRLQEMANGEYPPLPSVARGGPPAGGQSQQENGTPQDTSHTRGPINLSVRGTGSGEGRSLENKQKMPPYSPITAHTDASQNKHSPRARGSGRVYSNGSTYNPLLN